MKKKLVYTLFCLMLLFIGNNVYAAVDCDKYACATCVYSYATSTFTYNIKSDGNGSVDVEFKHNTSTPSMTAINKVGNNYFINSKTNKIECYPIKVTTIGSGRGGTYTLEVNDGTPALTANSDSTNNNKPVSEENLTSISCDYKSGKITCTATATDSKITGSCTDGYSFSNSLPLSEFGYGTKCPTASLVCSSRNGNYCGLDTAGTLGGSQEGTQSNTGNDYNDVSYECNYKGMINNSNLKILKLETRWEVTYPDGSVVKFPVNSVSSNVFPDANCHDIFYIPNDKILKRSVKTVTKGIKYQDIYIAQYCRKYDDVEQFCQNGVCKIKEPLCGNKLAEQTEYGTCPSELKPIIVFLKKVVFNTIQFIIPILLILLASIDLFKAIIASDDKLMKDYMGKLIKRILTAALLFFVTLIVTLAMDLLAEVPNINDATGWKACWHNIK